MKINLADGAKLHYRFIEGQRDYPYLVFLHEGLGCDAMWGDFPQTLCKSTGCPGLVYDRSGYGRSESNKVDFGVHYLHRYALAELPCLLEQLIPGLPFILIGHSDGASISLIFAADQSPLLLGVVSVAAHVLVEEVTLAGIHDAKRAWNGNKLNGLFRYHGDKTRRLFSGWSETWLQGGFKHWNIEYLLPSIKAPVLAIQGTDDQYGSELQLDLLNQYCVGSIQSELIVDCAHSPHKEAPQQTLQLMSGFIAKVNQVYLQNGSELQA